MDFFVNHTIHNLKTVKDAETRVKILHHVHRNISHFIQKKNPSRLSLDGNTDKKKKLYAQVAQRLAKEHGGKVRQHKTMTHIHFPKK